VSGTLLPPTGNASCNSGFSREEFCSSHDTACDSLAGDPSHINTCSAVSLPVERMASIIFVMSLCCDSTLLPFTAALPASPAAPLSARGVLSSVLQAQHRHHRFAVVPLHGSAQAVADKGVSGYRDQHQHISSRTAAAAVRSHVPRPIHRHELRYRLRKSRFQLNEPHELHISGGGGAVVALRLRVSASGQEREGGGGGSCL
jgi:hypothetical protein